MLMSSFVRSSADTADHNLYLMKMPVGTIIWTAPRGQTHTTRPGTYALFPTLCKPTAPVPVQATAVMSQWACTLTMPRRKRTRNQDRAERVRAERRYNENYSAERRLSAMLASERDKPPPF